MRFRIRHATTYRYDRPVALGRHIIRLHPRPDPYLRVEAFRITIHPPPLESVRTTDLDGNQIISAIFDGVTQECLIFVESEGETFARPSLGDLVGPSLSLPGKGSFFTSEETETVLTEAYPATASTSVAELTHAVLQESGSGTVAFLEGLSRAIHSEILNAPRLIGPPLPPELTLQEKKGSCRDIAVLFMASCRSLGLEARFVSGYIPAPPGEHQHMHAWAEVQIPEVGWYPFDPTQLGDIGEDHVAVATASAPIDASPVTGGFSTREGGFARSEMSVDLRVEMESGF